MKKNCVVRRVLVLGCLLMVWGCGNTQPTHFYLLRAMDPPLSRASVEAIDSGLSLGLGPISLAKYLDRPQIVTRASPHEIHLAEFHKWASPLKGHVSQILEENLSQLLATEGIVSYPWKRSNLPNFQLSLDIIQFDGIQSEEAVLKVRWMLAKDAGKTVLHNKTSEFSEIVQGPAYEDLAKAMSRMLASLSREIADAINVRSTLAITDSKPK